MIENDILLRVLNGEAVERPPVWMMRQAGRILPQYRALRARLSGFKELVTTPALAAEATLQPVDELGVDAAILFSDILVIPEAMGLNYEMEEKKGPSFPSVISDKNSIDVLLDGDAAASHLDYVYEAIKLTKQGLAGRVPLIGFSGAPWTLFAYMTEGGGSKTFSKAKKFLYTQPDLAHRLLDKLANTVISYLNKKILAGVDVVQVFDSWAGVLSPEQYREFSLPYIKKICDKVQGAPKIVFAKDGWFALKDMEALDCQAIGLDWTVNPGLGRKWVGTEKILQGNLDPCALYSPPAKIRELTEQMIREFQTKHIANLGHGLYPDTPLENVREFVNAVKGFCY